MSAKGKKNTAKKYKFKSLKVYADTTPLEAGRKHYQKVFENIQTTYLYAELCFLNRRLEMETWQAEVVLRCYQLNGSFDRVEWCSLSQTVQVLPEQEMVYVREGWGNDEPGHVWKRGDYCWEAYVDGEMVGTAIFYVEDSGPVTPTSNPYFQVNSIRLFEGPFSREDIRQKKYLRVFSHSLTRYIWMEILLENLLNNSWFCELECRFFNAHHHLLGVSTSLVPVRWHEKDVNIKTGWGSQLPGTWQPGHYFIEVHFMQCLIAVVLFDMKEDSREGQPELLTGDAMHYLRLNKAYGEKDEVVPRVKTIEALHQMIGLANIKEKVAMHMAYLEFIQVRKTLGFHEQEKLMLHTMLTGNPGTGKTTVARLLASIYHEMGLLSKGTFLEVGRAELIGQFIGQTAPKVRELIDSAKGGVLFIDEAYALARSEEDEKDYGREVIEMLVKEMSDGSGDLAIMVAGYPKEMDTFLQANPGLKSRFKVHYEFPDYTPDELMQIAEKMAVQAQVAFSPGALKYLKRALSEAYRNRDRTFGNARFVADLLEEAKMALGLRVMEAHRGKDYQTLKKSIFKTIHTQELKGIFEKKCRKPFQLQPDKPLLKETLAAIDALTGLQQVKSHIHELTRLVGYYAETSGKLLGKYSFHSVYKGNPGTGKTTVARLMARVYKALGILEKGHLVECSRQDLVAGFVGQTALKTKELFRKAMGGVLFIDEAYALFHQAGHPDFGKEALEVILKAMEDHRGEVIVVMAGYTHEMDILLDMNPGLKSRFDQEMFFEDYTVEELMQISRNMLKGEALMLDPEAEQVLRNHFEGVYAQRDQYFGNAREARKIADQVVRQQHLRMAALPLARRGRKALQTVLPEDLLLVLGQMAKRKTRKSIGFKPT